MTYRVLLFLLLSLIGTAQAADIENVKVVSVHDGDTFKIDIPNIPPVFGKGILVRVYGIDTPEMHGHLPCEQDKAKEAQKLAQDKLMHAKKIVLKNVQRDKYFRILADVMIDNQHLSDILLKANLGYSYFGDAKQKLDWCRK